jgi:hypothetical protein
MEHDYFMRIVLIQNLFFKMENMPPVAGKVAQVSESPALTRKSEVAARKCVKLRPFDAAAAAAAGCVSNVCVCVCVSAVQV